MQGPTTSRPSAARAPTWVTTPTGVHERRRRGLGRDVHLLATGDPTILDAALDRAGARLDQLEARCGASRRDSELSTLNHDGRIDGCSDDLLDAVEATLEISVEITGLGGPTVHHVRTVDRARRRVELVDGAHLDLEVVVTALAADALSAQLAADGCEGSCVDVGGVVRVTGRGPGGRPWSVGVDDPLLPGSELTRVRIGDGAVATTTSSARRGLLAVTVVAADARGAVALSESALAAGADRGAALIEAARACGLLVMGSGAVVRTPGFVACEEVTAIDLDVHDLTTRRTATR